jgi:hypothetical protein
MEGEPWTVVQRNSSTLERGTHALRHACSQVNRLANLDRGMWGHCVGLACQ